MKDRSILLFVQDVARELRIAPATARRQLHRFGRPIRVGRRAAIFREDFIRALRRLQGRRREGDVRPRDEHGRFEEGAA